jgi:hypothetical protein
MPLRPARHSDLPAISAILAAGFWDEEVVGDIMHPHRRQHPHDYAEYWHRKVREMYWNWSHVAIVSYEMKEEEEGGGQAEVITGVADWERKGKGWEGVWGLRSRWGLRRSSSSSFPSLFLFTLSSVPLPLFLVGGITFQQYWMQHPSAEDKEP